MSLYPKFYTPKPTPEESELRECLIPGTIPTPLIRNLAFYAAAVKQAPVLRFVIHDV